MRDAFFPVKPVSTPSGLQIVVERDPTAPLIAVALVVDAGSAADPPGREGLAHLVEHLSFRARTDGQRSHSDLLDVAGAGTWNAFTTTDLTLYYALASADAAQDLITLEISRALAPLKGIDAAAFDVEREVVRNELRERNEQGRVSAVDTELRRALYPGSSSYSRPVIGTEASVSALTLEDAQAFAQKHYLPRKMTLVIAGDLKLEEVGKLLDRALPQSLLDADPLAADAGVTRVSATAAAPPDPPPGPRVRRVKGSAELPVLHVAWALPPGFGKDGYLERFVQIGVEAVGASEFEYGDVAGVTSSLSLEKLGSTLVLSVTLSRPNEPERAMDRVLDQLYALWAPGEGNSAAEAKSHRVILGRLERYATVALAEESESLLDRTVKRAQLTHLTGNPTILASELRAMTQLGEGAFSTFAHRWLSRDRARAVYVDPDGSAPATVEGAPAVFAAVSNPKLSVPKEVWSRRVVPPGASVRSLKLSNGLEVVLAQRPAAPIVAMTLVSRGGRSDAEPLGAAELADMAEVRSDRNWFGVALGVSSSRWVNDSTHVLQYQGGNGNLANGLAMLKEAVESLRASVHFYDPWGAKARLFDLPHRRDERALREVVHRGTALARTASPAEVSKLSDSVANAWLERTLTPSNSVLVISGDLDPAGAEQAAREWLGDWKATAPAPQPLALPRPRADQPVPEVSTAWPGAVQTTVTLGCTTPAETEVQAAALRVLAGRLESRLHAQARTALGATYGFQSRVRVSRGVGELRVRGAIDQRGLPRILAMVRHEADALGRSAFSEADLAVARWREGIRANGRYDHAAALGVALAEARLSGFPVDTLERYPAVLETLRPEDVNQTAARCRETVALALLGDPTAKR
jgi:zinc protease